MISKNLESEYENKLIFVLESHSWFMNALNEVSKLDLTQWCIGAGVIRSIVFDYLENIPNTKIRDVDVAYFYSGDLSEKSDQTVMKKMKFGKIY